MRFPVVVALAAALPAAAEARQPIHESLVECAVMVELLLGEQTFIPGQNEMLDLYSHAARVMRAAAEDRTDAAYVTATAATKRETWHIRWDENGWDEPGNRGELGEWITYCFKLADHLDLPGPSS